MKEQKITTPDRRYEIDEPSEEVLDRISRLIGRKTTTILNITLADIYNDELPIPSEIENREIEFGVSFTANSYRGGLRVMGHTPDSEINNIAISIPSDKNERSTLRLLDTTPDIRED